MFVSQYSLPNVYDRLVKIAFDDNPSISELLLLVSALAVFWFVLCNGLIMILQSLLEGKEWIIKAGERDYERGGKELCASLGDPKTKGEFVQDFVRQWPWWMATCLQHFVGGILCIPAILGLMKENPFVASKLACLGILNEMAWEIQDFATWIFKRFHHKNGKQIVPLPMLIVMGTHHSLTTVLAIPVVIHYGDSNALHWLCFNLQAAAAISILVTEYTKLLDISNANELRQFRVLTNAATAIMLWTRGFHWFYLLSQLLMAFYKDEAWSFLVVGTMACLAFTGFNLMFCIIPYLKRCLKFARLSAEYESLAADVDNAKRRSSIIELHQAAKDIFADVQIQQDLSLYFMDRKVSRRRTLSSPSLSRGRPRSALSPLRASTGDISLLLTEMLKDFDPDDDDTAAEIKELDESENEQ